MKKILLVMALSASLAVNICAASTGVLPGPAPLKSSVGSKTPSQPAVTLQNSSTATVYLTAFEYPSGAQIVTYFGLNGLSTNHINFDPSNDPNNPPYVNLQVACLNADGSYSAPVFGGDYADGSTFIIPTGTCANFTLLKKK